MSVFTCPDNICPFGTVCPTATPDGSQTTCKACDRFKCGICDPENTAVCIGCPPGKFLVDNSCEYCSFGCESCSDSKHCMKCEPGRFLEDNYCSTCGPDCDSCASSTVCNTCKQGYFLTPDHTCQKCVAGCAECQMPQQCTRCASGFHSVGQTCQPCQERCEECSSSTNCTRCAPSASLKNSLCVSCVPHCAKCSEAGSCVTCGDGYVLQNSTCVSCGPHCRACSAVGECLLCEKDYTLAVRGDETICRYTECDKLNPCKTGKYCLAERGGNYCFTLEPNCIALSGFRVCSQCAPHYASYMNGCEKCAPNCEYCLNDRVCQNCFERYFVNEKSICERCAPGCKFCVNGATCYECLPGYALADGICEKLEKSECRSSTDCPTQSFCLQIPQFSSCETCIANCERCSSFNTCEVCAPGFVSRIMPACAARQAAPVATTQTRVFSAIAGILLTLILCARSVRAQHHVRRARAATSCRTALSASIAGAQARSSAELASSARRLITQSSVRIVRLAAGAVWPVKLAIGARLAISLSMEDANSPFKRQVLEWLGYQLL
uniref:Cysteine-rich protein n=1 Tax=Spironucleus salmonicida TaxID=348837 RepID=V6LSY9_9EUKA|eukprot:EST47373.1 Cysteine-rich protein [Spironucleus salmonicida]